ncbi:hypothetical protein BDF22DRAFT_687999 [Syncephalis plumigaleata]|nr:hypothetical protein BDF22DRAFT_687999 [Syncephalis plumigaleata]
MNVPVGRHTPPESSAMGARDSNEEIREEGEEEEVEEPPIPPMCDKAKEVLKRELNSLYEEFIGSSAPNEINLTADCRKRLDQAYKENRLSFEDFEPARYEVLQLIFQNTWPRMLRSQLR